MHLGKNISYSSLKSYVCRWLVCFCAIALWQQYVYVRFQVFLKNLVFIPLIFFWAYEVVVTLAELFIASIKSDQKCNQITSKHLFFIFYELRDSCPQRRHTASLFTQKDSLTFDMCNVFTVISSYMLLLRITWTSFIDD